MKFYRLLIFRGFLIILIICIYIIFRLIFYYNNIIVSKNYKNFDYIKEFYIKNEFFKPFLEQVTILSHIYLNQTIRNKNIINISLSLNNKYIYITLVSIESILINCNKKKTFIRLHILCSPDIENSSISIIKSLMKDYSSNLELIFYNMGNNFIKFKKNIRSQATYFRLLLPIIVSTDRIIYLDGDTITLKDLTEMYNSNFENNYVLGFLGLASGGLDYLGIRANNWINAGVLLLNLKKIRDDNKCYKLLDIIKRGTKLKHDDNTVINYAFYPNIGKLPIKYGIFNFFDVLDVKKYSRRLRQKINISEYEEAMKDPGILHNVLCIPKPWYYNTNFFKQNTECEKRKNCSCEKYLKIIFTMGIVLNPLTI